jgi:hypothetical protein
VTRRVHHRIHPNTRIHDLIKWRDDNSVPFVIKARTWRRIRLITGKFWKRTIIPSNAICGSATVIVRDQDYDLFRLRF